MTKAYLAILPLCLVLGACQFEASKDSAVPAPVVPQSEGNSSGGGGFGDESSMQLLKATQQIVARALRQTNPEVFKSLPKDWSPERLAKLIENVRPEPNKVVSRYNRELMFDYVVPKEGEPYLIATSLFFRAFASVPASTMQSGDLEPYYRMLRIRLLHEAAHVLGIGTSEETDYKARVFATYLGVAIWNNNVVCTANEVPQDYPGHVTDSAIEDSVKKRVYDGISEEGKTFIRDEIKAQPYVWMINRGFGFGIQTRRFAPSFVNSQSYFLNKLLAGTPTTGGDAMYQLQSAKNPHLLSYTEPQRIYDPFVNEDRADQTYYKVTKNTNDGITFQGLFSQTPTVNSPNVKACSTSETFRFPKEAFGKYDISIEYYNDCPWYRSETAIAKGSIPVKCVESYTKIDSMNEFYGDQKFQNPTLVHLIPDESFD